MILFKISNKIYQRNQLIFFLHKYQLINIGRKIQIFDWLPASAVVRSKRALVMFAKLFPVYFR